jgi:hypothetical protein
MELLVLAAIVWWTFAVALLAIIVAASDITTSKDVAFVVGLSVFWPVTASLAIPALIYQATVAGTQRIRIDLKNRGVLLEFEDWLRNREKQPKDKQ